MHQSVTSFFRALAGLLVLLLGSQLSLLSQVNIPAGAAVSGAVQYPGGSLKGEYWKRMPNTILTDGSGNRADGIDNQINTFGTPDGKFKATKLVYLGNDLTQVQNWLSDDAPSYSGISSNLDDGAFRFTGYINITAPGTLNMGTTSDDGARIKIAGIDVNNGDGSHGDETHDADVNFESAGLYPIEITYFNGDWTSDGNNHTGNPDPGAHGGANFHLRMGGADVGPAQVAMLHPVPPRPQVAFGLSFGADEPNGAGSALAPGTVAGAVPQANWNNLTGASGSAANLKADATGTTVPSALSVTWSCPNTWSSTGRGEENNGFPAGGDQTLMTGYLDTDNGNNVATVAVTGIPADFTSGGYDVLVYCIGGVGGRGGAYTINGETKYGTAPTSPTAHSEDPGVDVTDTGTYVRFRGLFTSSFTLVSSANAAIGGGLVNFRAPINAIQIVKNQDPQAGLAPGFLVKHRYDNIGGGVALNDLLTNPKYLNDQADVSCLRTDFSENDANECDSCGYSVRGFFIPKVSGPHTFYMSSDDGGGLFLSSDDNPANKVQIASEPLWSGRRTYTGPGDGGGRGAPPSNISAPINLSAGTLYYIEGVTKEGGGGDNLDVAVQGPGDPPVVNGDRPINGTRIAAYIDLTGSSLVITQNPVDIRVPEGDSASFSVSVSATTPLCGGVTLYQWQRNGVDIPGATAATYSFGPVRPEDHLALFSVVVRIPGVARTSTSAKLEVLGRECLKVANLVGSGDLTHATVQFSSFLDAANPANTDPNNFEITGPGGSILGVSGAALLADGKSVTLTTDAQAENTLYTVTVLPDTITSIVGTTVCAPPTNSGTFTSWSSDPNGGLLFEAFFNIGGTPVVNLTSNAKFPNRPDVIMIIGGFDSRLAFADDSHENYGGRIRGLFIPPASGDWVFYLASDDASQLFLNPNGPNASGAIKIQEETGCCNAYTAHKSAAYSLIGGKPYYIEALYKEGGGGDYCRVEARFAADAPPTGGNPNDSPSIPGARLGFPAAPLGIGGALTINQQPASQSVSAGSLVSFTVGASNPNGLPITYQWTRDGVDIPGANGPSYGFGPLALTDDGAVFAVRVGMIGARTVSQDATLQVFADTVRPTAVSASGALNLSNVVVRFSEFMHAQELADPANYSVPGFLVVAAVANADGQSATVTLDGAMAIGGTYSIAVNSLTDLAGNEINPDPTTLTFKAPVISCGFALQELYLGIGGTSVSDLTGNPKYPASPDSQTYVSLLEGPLNAADNYGTSISGWLVPPVSGNYNFFISSDDNSAFFLSTDDSPVNLVQVCNEPAWASSRHWTGEAEGGGRGSPPANQSSALFPDGIPLSSDHKYYFQLLAKEGGGGDNCAVAWQMPGQPVPANGSSPIPGAYLASLADPAVANVCSVRLEVIRNGNILTLKWATGTLEVANDITGPWVPVAGATSPLVTPIDSTLLRRFARVRIQ